MKKAQQFICTQCSSKIYPIEVTPGSFSMEVILWLFFLIPGLIYSFWRLGTRHEECPYCGSRSFIPINTPKGHILASQGHDENSISENSK